MKKQFNRSLAICLFLLIPVSLLLSNSVGLAQTGKKWIDMDYGPNMTHSFEVDDSPSRNLAYKGMKITVGDQGAMLFDEDLLRWAGGWENCDLDWRNVIYDGSHGTHPKVLGSALFVTDPKPGWNTSDDFSDPRKLPYGPLPHQHSRFQGVYRHSDQLVVKFNVGKTTVLENASLQNGYVTRTIKVGAGEQNLYTRILTTSEDEIQTLEKDGVVWVVIGKLPEAKVEQAVNAKPAPALVQNLIGHYRIPDSGKGVINDAAKSAATNMGVRLTPAPKEKGMSFDGRSRIEFEENVELGDNDFSIVAWVKTTQGGTIAAKGPREGRWAEKGKSLFVRSGKLVFDVGWVGAVTSSKRIADGKWHAVAVTYDSKSGDTVLYVDGKKEAAKKLLSKDDDSHRFRLGYTATNFAPPLKGALDDVRLYDRKLTSAEIGVLAGGVKSQPSLKLVGIVGASKGQVSRKDKDLILRLPAGKQSVRIQFYEGDDAGKEKFLSQLAKSREVLPIENWTQGGPANYPQQIVTQGEIAANDKAYVVDTITLPSNNQWKSWMRLGGFDFFRDSNRAAICTWSGDVWTVEGVAGSQLGILKWRRIATGMFQPLGLKIVNDEIYVGCRDQLTKLVDLNNDGETDFYQTINNDHQVTEHFHEFAMDLQTDEAGNFYYAKSARHALDSVVPHHGTLMRISPDGSKSEIVCNGFRAANGVGLGPKGEMATSDQEGHWTPANRINLVVKDGFYGNMYSYHRGEKPEGYDPPVVWLPKNVDRSPAAQLWVDSREWGPFNGKMLSTSYGTGKLWHVMYEQVGDGLYQGGVVQFPLQFPTGVMRGRFHPLNGQLYTCGLFGWSSNRTQEGGFYRVRYTGKPANMPVKLRTAEDGLYLTFSDPLDKESASDSDNFNVEQWNYRWTKNYGSAHYSVENPKQKGQDEVEVWETTLLEDGKTIFIEIEDLQEVMQMQIDYTLKSAAGADIKDTVWLTINKIPK